MRAFLVAAAILATTSLPKLADRVPAGGVTRPGRRDLRREPG
jgi:hypothetical protein